MARPTRCPRCGRDNHPSFAFCLDCGAALERPDAPPPTPAPNRSPCPSCGARLLPGFRFCARCGLPVAAPASATPAAPSAPPTPRAAVPERPTAEASGAAPAVAGALRLVVVRHDGFAGASHPLDRGETICGRDDGAIRFPDDPTVSPRHARFVLGDAGLEVEDLASLNGTFLRLRAPRRLAPGDALRVGRQVLRLEAAPRPAPDATPRPWGAPDPGHALRLVQLLDGGGAGEIFPLRPGENALGREVGDVTFPGDRYVSARHARLEVSGTGATVADLGSSNGTFVRVEGPTPLAPGDQLLLGAQLLRIEG